LIDTVDGPQQELSLHRDVTHLHSNDLLHYEMLSLDISEIILI